MDRLSQLIGAEIRPAQNGAIEYKGNMFIMNNETAEGFAVDELWSMVRLLEDPEIHRADPSGKRAVYMAKLVHMHKCLGCGYEKEIDYKLRQFIEKEKNMYKKLHGDITAPRPEQQQQ